MGTLQWPEVHITVSASVRLFFIILGVLNTYGYNNSVNCLSVELYLMLCLEGSFIYLKLLYSAFPHSLRQLKIIVKTSLSKFSKRLKISIKDSPPSPHNNAFAENLLLPWYGVVLIRGHYGGMNQREMKPLQLVHLPPMYLPT